MNFGLLVQQYNCRTNKPPHPPLSSLTRLWGNEPLWHPVLRFATLPPLFSKDFTQPPRPKGEAGHMICAYKE